MKIMLKMTLAIVLITVVAYMAIAMRQVQTYVQIVYGDYLIEMSFWVLLGLFVSLLFIMYFISRLAMLLSPIQSFRMWRYQRQLKDNNGLIQQAIRLFFEGKVKAANKKLTQATKTQPVLAGLLLSIFNDEYANHKQVISNENSTYSAILNFLWATSLVKNNEFKKAYEIIKQDRHYFSKQPNYLALALKIATKEKQFDLIKISLQQYQFNAPLHDLFISAAVAYLDSCQQHQFGHEQIITRFNSLSNVLKEPPVIASFAANLVILLPVEDAKKRLLKLANPSLLPEIVDAFLLLGISDEQKLQQLELWYNKGQQQNSDLLRSLVAITAKLKYETKSQQYQHTLEQLQFTQSSS